MSLLRDKNVVITGSSSGIGRGCAIECAAHGTKLILHHLGTAQTEQDARALQIDLETRFSTKAIIYGVDLTEDEAPEKLIDFAVSQLGHVDVLVNNAAIFKPLPASQVTKSLVGVGGSSRPACPAPFRFGPGANRRIPTRRPVWRHRRRGRGRVGRQPSLAPEEPGAGRSHVSINFVALYLATQAATKHMVERGYGGSIVTISSNTVVVGTSDLAHYAGSKAAGLAMMQNLAVEYGPHNIRYNCVLPGPTDTQMVAEYTSDHKAREAMNTRCPMGRIATPADIARSVVFFASDLSSFVTGQHIVVDGGSSYRFL